MSPELAILRTCLRQGVAGLMLAGALAGCGGGGGGAEPPQGVVHFGPLSDEPVDFTLTGTVRYEDRLLGEKAPGEHGFTGATEFNPVRHATVDVVDENDAVLQSTRTDDDGRYRLSARAAGLLRLRVLARTDPAGGIQVEVRTPAQGVYAASRYFVPGEGTHILDSDIPVSAMGGAFNILDLFAAGAEFLHARPGGAWPPRLVTYWHPASRDGTYFTGGAVAAIHVCGGCASGDGHEDTDEYDDDVLLHEYGHFIESLTGKLDSPGGHHVLGDNTQDLRLAWSEGWASYAAGTLKAWIKANRPAMLSHGNQLVDSYYLDTVGNDARVLWIFDADFSNRSAYSAAEDEGSSYASSETAVAKVLWNLNRGFGFGPIWNGYRQAGHDLRPASLETFWDQWLVENLGRDPLPGFRERRVEYAPDLLEPDSAGAARPLAPGADSGLQTLYLEGAADIDYFTAPFAPGTSYLIETFDLRNGADTLLSIHRRATGALLGTCGDSGTETCASDDIDIDSGLNDGCNLASRLRFTPQHAGPYYLKVQSAETPSRAAGRYGAYRIRVRPYSVAYACP